MGLLDGARTVMSGASQVAVIDFIGHYTSANFRVTAGVSGTVAILGPAVVNGGSVDTGSATILGRHHGVDVSQIAFGAQTTLAYAETGGTLTVDEGRHAASIALLGNYTAGSFVATAEWPRGRFAHPGGADGTAVAVDAPGPIALGGRTREATEVGANGN
jgi:hypothetical protein